MPIEQTSLYDQAYTEYLEHAKDPVWRLAFEIYLGETFQEMVTYHQGQIQAIADKVMHSELGQMRKALTKHYLASRIEEIQKKQKHKFDEHNWQRRGGQFARYVGPDQVQERGPQGGKVGKPRPLPGLGRAHWSAKIDDPQEFLRESMRRDASMLDSTEQRQRLIGLKTGNAKELPALPKEALDSGFALPQLGHQADVISRTAELHNDLFHRTNNPDLKQRVQYVIQSPDGSKRIEMPRAGDLPDVDYVGGERVHFMTPIGPDNPVSVGGRALNMGLVAGMSSEQAAKVGGVTEGIHNVLGQTNWGKKMQATAQTLAAVSGGSPLAVQAHAFAQMVNLIGPQASRAFGGKFRQLTYRYTGQEVAPEDYSEVAISGKQPGENTAQFEQRLMLDLVPTIPTSTEYRNSMKSGSTPPSHGFILDRNGKVVSQAVGMSDDWYTPFNMQKLPQMRGGTYVRTRSYGGLTPEDIRLAMRTGATRATVISNNGVFSMEFNPKALHWGHRWGFAGAAMVRRYTKSLDAIKHSKVENPDEQGQHLKLNARGYEAAMQDLKLKYPYWVVAPNKTELGSFQRDLQGANGLGIDVREHQSDPADDEGYISPVNSRASGAMHGWYDPDIESFNMWESPDSGKVAYNTMDRYQVHHETLLNAHRVKAKVEETSEKGQEQTKRQGGRPGGGQQGGGQRTQGRDDPRPSPPEQQVQGAGRRQEIETLDENKVDPEAVHDLLMETRRLMMQGYKNGEPDGIDPMAESDADDDFKKIAHMLTRYANPQQSPRYEEELSKLANSKQARDNLISNLDLVYAGTEGKIDSGDRDKLLQGWEWLHRTAPRQKDRVADQAQDDADAGAAAAVQWREYSDRQMLPRKQVEDSTAIQHWIRGNAASAQDKEDYNIWLAGHASSGNKLDKPQREAFWRMNRKLSVALSDENRREWEKANKSTADQVTEGTVDDGARLTDKQVSPVVTTKANEPAADHAMGFIRSLNVAHPGKSLLDDVVYNQILDRMEKAKADAKELKDKGMAGAPWHEKVASELQAHLSRAYDAQKRLEAMGGPSDDELDEMSRQDRDDE